VTIQRVGAQKRRGTRPRRGIAENGLHAAGTTSGPEPAQDVREKLNTEIGIGREVARVLSSARIKDFCTPDR